MKAVKALKIRFEKKKSWWLAALAFGIAAAAAQLYAGQQLGASLLRSLLFSGALGLAAAASAVVRVELKSWWSVLLELVCTAFVALLLLHYVLIRGAHLPGDVFVNNMLVSLAAALIGTALTGCPRLVSIVWLVFCWGVGMANCAVYQFRGNLITLSDVFSIGTALDVAGNYRFEIMPRMLTVSVILAISLALLLRARVEKGSMRRWPVRVLMLVLAVATAWRPAVLMQTMLPSTYGLEGAYYKGLLMNVLTEVKLLRIREPEGYDLEMVQQLLEESGENTSAGDTASDDTPHVIAIMVEALSDLTVAGDFETSESVMPFTENFLKETIHGYALSPVFGGGTCNSEWEFLTGNSNAYVPYHANVYRLYTRTATNSIVQVFNNMGYTTVGMHPYHAKNWDRLRVYPQLGFEETYFLEDLDWGETVRGLVSDRAYVRKVIERFESRDEDEKMFIFGVTMQNHSDYMREGLEQTVQVVGLDGDYPDVNQYLSLLQLTDKAIEDLITYFKASDERVQIVLFGDHQPGVSNAFYDEIGVDAIQDKYLVPYFLWKNYEEDAAEMPVTSLNYLPVMMLESIGAEMPAYYEFLSELRETVPAFNRYGYMIDGVNVQLEEAQGEILEMLNRYEIIQYANMFDADADAAMFVG